MENPLTYFSPKVEKRKSGIEGTGLYAIAPIAQGEVVVVKGGHVMDKETRDRVGAELGPTEIQIGDGLFIGPLTAEEREGCMMYLNHSCAPNVGLRGEITFIAMRDIAAGEEIAMDYAMMDDEPDDMTCRCGAPQCRGTISGIDWKVPELQRRYRSYFSRYLQDKIDAAKS
jgi:hypothetical protein